MVKYILPKYGYLNVKLIAFAIVFICFLAGTYYVYEYLPVQVEFVRDGPAQVGVDWKGAFRPASIELSGGHSPYKINSFYNPPWVLLPLIPIALLSPAFGSAIMYVLNLLSYFLVAYKLKMNLLLIVPFFLFSGMILNSNNGNIEGLLALGFILPPQISLFFVLAKPQLGIAVSIFWFVESWRSGGVTNVVRIFLPVGIVYLVSFLFFGFWLRITPSLIDVWWNTTIFPIGIPIGLILLLLALWKREIKFAIAASPFFSPYLAIHTWAVVWLGLLSLFPNEIHFFRNILASPNKK